MKNVFEYFGAVVLDPQQPRNCADLSLLSHGIVFDFWPTAIQIDAIREAAGPNPVCRTFFSTQDIKTLSTDEKILKQLVHYFLVYGMGAVVDFPRAEDGSKTVPVKLVRGITHQELVTEVQRILYRNAPAKNTEQLAAIIAEYDIPYTFAEILNNELRIALYRPNADVFATGDDAIRYICKIAGQSDLLIKSRQVLANIRLHGSLLPKNFIRVHARLLAQVFNRHKAILLALKTARQSSFKSDINHVSRLSKRLHQPVPPQASKMVIANFMAGRYVDVTRLTVRDKLKLLNLLEFKKQGETTDVFTVRNGKMYVKDGRPVLNKHRLSLLSAMLISSLAQDLAFLDTKTILFDAHIDYGLPVSRKQTVGQLPFGTVIRADGLTALSSGIFWENAGGANDIDLSTVDADGNTTGWGRMYSYDKTSPITFSGDVTYAPDGAMEFMTSGKGQQYGLFVNIFSGRVPSTVQLVVGERSEKQWMANPLIRETFVLQSKQTIVGFVDGLSFTVFSGRTGQARVSGSSDKIFMVKNRSMVWTVKKLLDQIGITYHEGTSDVPPDFDLRYAGFTFDALESMLNIS